MKERASDPVPEEKNERRETPAGPASLPPERHPGALPFERPYPTWVDGLVFVGIVVASSFAAGLIVMLLGLFFGQLPLQGGTPLMALSYLLTMGLTILGSLLYRRYRGQRGVVFRFARSGWNPVLILWGVVLVAVTGVVIEPLLDLFPSVFMEYLDRSMGRGGWTIAMLVLFAPLCEELLFRGVVLESVRRKSGAARAVLVSAVLFGIIHVIPQQVVNAFFVGLILGYIYIRTESLISVIIIHALNNAVAYVAMLWFGDSTAGMRELIGNEGWYKALYVVSLLVFCAAAYMVWRSLRAQKAGDERPEEAQADNNRL